VVDQRREPCPFVLGIDAAKLAVKYQGLDVRLTGPEGGSVVRDIIM
jgi:hypothetical protein